MVVAFIAVEACGEKQMSRVFHRLRGRAQDFPITGSRIFARRAGGDQNLSRELVVGSVLFDLAANPGAERLSAFSCEEFAVALEEIGPFVSPEINELRAADEMINDLVALHSCLTRV